jgi:transposase
MGRHTSIHIELTDEERTELERRARLQVAPHRIVARARVVLMLADGKTLTGTATQVGLQRRIVRKWGERFVRKRLRGLEDEPHTGRPARFSP